MPKKFLERPYQICTKCILDTNDDLEIRFDESGVCNHCHEYKTAETPYQISPDEKEKWIKNKVAEIKNYGKGKKYDCIFGVSGGVDSTYLSYWVKQWGLRPLLVHFDNGWNSELAVKNIENIVQKLDFDLYTYVVDWEEFRDLQLSYFKAGVLDLEVPTDHGFFACLYKAAEKNKIKYILSGHNIVTEYVLPDSMKWPKMDLMNLEAIHKQFGTRKLKTFPKIGFFKKLYYDTTRKFELVRFLNYMDYQKDQAKQLIVEKLEWRDYGGKHYESLFTRFFQGYILPEKFKVDKRRAHLANLVMSGQITREQALAEAQKPVYDPEQLKVDKEFVLKKLGMTEEEFSRYMDKPFVSHSEFPSYISTYYTYHRQFFKLIKPVKPILKKGFKILFPKGSIT